jgi:SPP1 family predicted phage head-tail adaptor
MAYRRIGELDRRVTILEAVTADGIGGETETQSWSEAATVWAKYEPATGAEGVSDNHERTKMTALFTIRHGQEVSAQNRLRFDGHDWRIESVSDAQRNRAVEIRAEAVDRPVGA